MLTFSEIESSNVTISRHCFNNYPPPLQIVLRYSGTPINQSPPELSYTANTTFTFDWLYCTVLKTTLKELIEYMAEYSKEKDTAIKEAPSHSEETGIHQQSMLPLCQPPPTNSISARDV